jgi:hypothetical protein
MKVVSNSINARLLAIVPKASVGFVKPGRDCRQLYLATTMSSCCSFCIREVYYAISLMAYTTEQSRAGLVCEVRPFTCKS